MALGYDKKKPASQGKKGEKGGGCRHFHVHYHFPRHIYFFPFFSLSSYFSLSLTSCLFLPPVLFFSVLVFLVSFIWFTLLYFISFLFTKDTDHDGFKNNDMNVAIDVDKNHEEEEGEEEWSLRLPIVFPHASLAGKEDVEKVAKGAPELPDTSDVEIFAYKHETKEVVIHEFANEDEIKLGMALSNALVHEEVHNSNDNLPEEIIKVSSKDLASTSADFDDFAGKHEIRRVSIDGFANENKIRDVTSLGASVHEGISNDDEEFIKMNSEELSGTSAEVHDFADKHEIRGVAVNRFANEHTIREVASSFVSAHEGIGDEDDKPSEEFIKVNSKELSGTSAEVYDFADNHEETGVAVDGFTNGHKLRDATLSDGSFHEGIGDEDGKHSEETTTKESPLKLPPVRRPQMPWWNFCGVLDVFLGSKD